MFRYFIYLAYDGTNYHGWQMQPNGVSVQETLVKALVTFLRDDAIGVTGKKFLKYFIRAHYAQKSSQADLFRLAAVRLLHIL